MKLKDLIVDAYLLKERSPMRYIRLVRMPYRGGVRWAIRDETDNYVLTKDKKWMTEPSPSNREEGYYQLCRWDTAEEALAFWEEYLVECEGL